MPRAGIPGHRSNRVLHRDLIKPVGLVLLIVGPCLLYAWYAAHLTLGVRLQQALQRNQEIAQLTARLLDEQWDIGVSILHALDTRRLLAMLVTVNGQIDRSHAQTFLHDAVALDPDLLVSAVYDNHGNLVASYPGHPLLPVVARDLEWFRSLSTRRNAYFGAVSSIDTRDLLRIPKSLSRRPPTEAIVFAVPIISSGRSTGYLVAYYRLSEIDAWLQQIRVSDGSILYIADVTGRVLTASGGASNRSVDLAHYAPLQRALRGVPGSMPSPAPQGRLDAIVGYAYAAKPGWPVLVVQPRRTTLASAYLLLSRLSVLLIPILALMFGGCYALARMVHTTSLMASQLSEQNEMLRAADQAKSEFLANVSHDLRTPLAGLTLSLSGLLEPGMHWEPDQVRDCLHLASVELDQLTARVRNLLEMSRIDARALTPRLELADLTDVVGSALERLSALTRGRSIRAEFPSEPMLVECDYGQVETVVINIIENAVKYSSADAAIELCGWRRDNWVGCTIRDHGHGIPEEDTGRIFEKFYRSAAVRSIGGTGLGLAICRAIIEAHGGAITARNYEHGAEFEFCLIAAQAASGGSHERR